MTDLRISPEQVEDRCDLGLLNSWYAVLPAWAVNSRPIGITRLGQNIALWRDKSGQVHALEDRCPHRGTRLSLGWNLDDRLACWYHGVEVNKEGIVVDVPAVTRCLMKDKKCVTAYPVKEIKEAIFLYFGTPFHSGPVSLKLPEQLTNEQDYDAMLCVAKWHVNYRYAIDNVMDPMHGAYLHAASHSMACGDKTAEMQSRETKSGFIFEKKGQQGVNFDRVEWADTGIVWMRLELPYRKNAGPGGHFGIIAMATPVDREHCLVFFWRTRKVKGWQRDVWRFMYKTRLEKLHWDVLEQDRIVLENLAPNARTKEFLYQHDAGLAKVRRMLEQKTEQQLMMLRESETSVATQNSPGV